MLINTLLLISYYVLQIYGQFILIDKISKIICLVYKILTFRICCARKHLLRITPISPYCDNR